MARYLVIFVLFILSMTPAIRTNVTFHDNCPHTGNSYSAADKMNPHSHCSHWNSRSLISGSTSIQTKFPKTKIQYLSITQGNNVTPSPAAFLGAEVEEFVRTKRQNHRISRREVFYQKFHSGQYRHPMGADKTMGLGKSHRHQRTRKTYTHLHKASRVKFCERIKIPMCQSLPYNSTQMPNYFHQFNQQNARLVMDNYKLLLKTNCSPDLAFFLCSLYVPICRHDMVFGDATTKAPNQPSLQSPPYGNHQGDVIKQYGDNVQVAPLVGPFKSIINSVASSQQPHETSGSQQQSYESTFLELALEAQQNPYQTLNFHVDGEESLLLGLKQYTNKHEGVILPCRHVCLDVKKGCEPLLKKFNISWPANLACHNFPLYELDICISPQTIISSTVKPTNILASHGISNSNEGSSLYDTEDSRSNASHRNDVIIRRTHHHKRNDNKLIRSVPNNENESRVRKCQCPKNSNRLRKDNILSQAYNYAIQIKTLGLVNIKGSLALKAEILHIFLPKISDPTFGVGNIVSIYLQEQCVCPIALSFPSRSYLMFGHMRDGKYIYSINKGIALPWKDKLKKRVEKLLKRIRNA